MAQITLSSRATPSPYRSDKGDFRISAFQPSTAASTAGIAFGDVVVFDQNTSTANHRVTRLSTITGGGGRILSTAVIGIAVEAESSSPSASAANASKVLVASAGQHTEFKFASKLTGAQHASSIVGTRMPLGYDSTLGIVYVDVANSSAGDASVIVTELLSDEGTTNGFVAAKFISTQVARLISGAF